LAMSPMAFSAMDSDLRRASRAWFEDQERPGGRWMTAPQ
jgi:hypothetical protein